MGDLVRMQVVGSGVSVTPNHTFHMDDQAIESSDDFPFPREPRHHFGTIFNPKHGRLRMRGERGRSRFDFAWAGVCLNSQGKAPFRMFLPNLYFSRCSISSWTRFPPATAIGPATSLTFLSNHQLCPHGYVEPWCWACC